MGIIDTSTVLGNSLGGASQGIGNTVGQLRTHLLRMQGDANDTEWATTYGVASSNRTAVQDIISGAVTITQNSTAADLTGLWGRIAELLGVALPIMAQSTTDEGKAVARLMLDYGSQISTIVAHNVVLTKLIADNNEVIATTLYGLSGTDLTDLSNWTDTAATLIDNFAGTAITSGEQHVYKLAYEAV